MVSNTTSDSDFSVGNADWRDRTALWLFGLLWVLPFLQPWHNRPMLHFYSEWLAVALALAGCALLFARRGAIIALPAALPWLLGLLAWAGLQLAWVRPVFPQSAWSVMIYLGWAGLVMLAASSLRARFGLARLAEAVAWGALAGGVLDAAAGLMQIYGAPGWLASYVMPGGEVTSIVGNSRQQNHLGDHVMMGLAGALYLCARGHLPWAGLGVAGAVMLPALALCASRSVLAYFLWLLLLTGGGWASAARDTEMAAFARRMLKATAGAMVVFLLLQGVLPWLSGAIAATTRPGGNTPRNTNVTNTGGNAVGGGGTNTNNEKVEFTERLSSDKLAKIDANATEQGNGSVVSAEALKGFSQSEQPIYVTVNREHNLIVVRTSDVLAIKDIESLVKEMDRPTPQVLLEMKILSLEIGDKYRQSFDLDYVPNSTEVYGPPTDQDKTPLFTPAVRNVTSTQTIGPIGNQTTITSTGVISSGVRNVLGLGPPLQLVARPESL